MYRAVLEGNELDRLIILPQYYVYTVSGRISNWIFYNIRLSRYQYLLSLKIQKECEHMQVLSRKWKWIYKIKKKIT